VIAVGENKTSMAVLSEALGIRAISVKTYLEAIGAIAAYKAGVAPDLLTPDIAAMRSLS